jgi:ABC-type lipoprotein export system ATPase subunit
MPSTETQPTQACRVSVRGVHKSYRQGSRSVQALRGVDLQIEGPGFHAIMGPSGSGKSTLLYLLAGLDIADAGEIRVGDVSLANLSEAELTLHRRRRSGVIFQGFNLLPTLLADEPTGNLDSQTSDRLWRLLAEIAARRNMLVLMVTHEPLAAVHCQRVHVLRDGVVAGNIDLHGMDPSQLAVRVADTLRAAR